MSTFPETQVLEFFQRLYQYDEGYVCIATTRPPARRDTFREEYFMWPADQLELIEYIDKVRPTHNVYFCVNVMEVARRKKDNAIPQNLVWADLDTCDPQKVEIPPQIVIESSPNRWQAIWKLDEKIDPLLAEQYSKRIAYHYADQGADKSGYDLTQLLRVPGTYNYKYAMDDAPMVELVADLDATLPISVFAAMEPVGDQVDLPDIDVPDVRDLPTNEMIIYRYTDQLTTGGLMNAFARYVGEEPRENWSLQLRRLLLLCFEAGMTAEETFVIAKNSKCNKYERDGRPDSHLWREVLKAELDRKTVETLLRDHRYLAMPQLLTPQEVDELQPTLVDDYMEWATNATDAVPDFHELCCVMLMSAFMSTTLRLRTSQSLGIVPNLWGLILGDSTLTRKTTSMDMAMQFIHEIDPDMFATSDSSMEGLMHTLSLRPKMVSIFFRDEITGFFNSVQQKDYLAGMHEALTKMYDVPKMLKRTLRKETFVVSEPIFMMFGGGIANKAYSLINEEYITSGFIPRFLMVHGHADIENVRPLGPPKQMDLSKREQLHSTFQAFYSTYTNAMTTMTTHDGQTLMMPVTYEVKFTDDMWERAAVMEHALLKSANDSPEADKAKPMFSRLYMSMIKLTMLFAGARQEPKDTIVQAEMRDLLSAANYIQKWGIHAVEVTRNSGHSAEESKLMACYRSIESRPGMLRSEIMQKHRLNAKEMQVVEDTLVQRAMVEITKRGMRIKTYWPIGR